MDEIMRMRAFDYHWAEAILKGYKNIEVGSQVTKPGTIAIYAKKKEITKHKKKEIVKHFSLLCDSGFINYNTFHELHKSVMYPEHLGYILGTVEIAYVRKQVSKLQFHGSQGMHLAPDEYYKEGHTHFWVLKNPVKFDKPIKIEKYSSGGPWAKINKSLLDFSICNI